MPFTGSHPAAVLPFVRRLPASALVFGSMAPDFPYYVPLPVSGPTTHSWLGVVTVDVVLAAAAWAVWRFLVGPAVLALVPALRRRLPRLPDEGPPVLVAVAFVVGNATHVAWDSFTHGDMWGPEHLPALRATYGPVPGYAWAQYASSLVGGAVLLWWCWRWWRRQPVTAVPPPLHPWSVPAAWTAVVVATLAGTAWGFLGGAPLHVRVFEAATDGGAAGAATVVLVSVAWTLVGPRGSVGR
jgi:hypothetical protein